MQLNFLYFPHSIQQDVISNNNFSSETVFSVKQNFFFIEEKMQSQNYKLKNGKIVEWVIDQTFRIIFPPK